MQALDAPTGALRAGTDLARGPGAGHGAGLEARYADTVRGVALQFVGVVSRASVELEYATPALFSVGLPATGRTSSSGSRQFAGGTARSRRAQFA